MYYILGPLCYSAVVYLCVGSLVNAALIATGVPACSLVCKYVSVCGFVCLIVCMNFCECERGCAHNLLERQRVDDGGVLASYVTVCAIYFNTYVCVHNMSSRRERESCTRKHNTYNKHIVIASLRSSSTQTKLLDSELLYSTFYTRDRDVVAELHTNESHTK